MNISDLDFVDSINIHSIAGGTTESFANLVVFINDGQTQVVSTSDVQTINDIWEEILGNFQVQLSLYS